MAEIKDDILLAQLRRASDLIEEVRLAQRECGKTLGGHNHILAEQQQAITSAADCSGLVLAIREVIDADATVHALFERFEEMCRRRKVFIGADLRPSLLKILAAELFANYHELNASAEQMLSVSCI